MSPSSYRHILTSLLLCLVSSSTLLLPASASTPPPPPAKQPRSALLIVDMQNCFSPSGSLAVPGFLSLLPVINRLHTLPLFSLVALSQDYHPLNHISFANTWPDAPEPFTTTRQLHYHNLTGQLCTTTTSFTTTSTALPPSIPAQHCHPAAPVTRVSQTLWPQHCVQGADDARFHSGLLRLSSDVVVRKGQQAHIDSYSAFHDALATARSTELGGVLRGAGVTRLYVVGVALDVCVAATVMDGVSEGLEVMVVEDGVAGIDRRVMAEKRAMMEAAGVRFVHSSQLPGWNDAEPTTTTTTTAHERLLDVEVAAQ